MFKRLRIVSIALVATLLYGLVAPFVANAAVLSSASVALGDPRPSQTSTYTFDASGFSTGTTIRCVELVLNDQADGAGSIPAGITTTSSTLDSGTALPTVGSWTVDNSTNGTLGATWATGEAPNASGNIVWGNVTNGNTEGTTYFGIFTSYTDASCTGGNEVDEVTVAWIYKDGELVELTIDPTLTFVCAAVAASQSVNGATTTEESTASGIDFENAVTSSANGISAHDLQVSTNATAGYVVYIRHTGQLTNATAATIDNHTGTNAVPTAFPAAGTEAWGYTTEDSNLTGGTGNRFTTGGGDVWAGFTTSNDPIIDNTAAPVGTETTRVGHQVGIAATTEAGTYQTTIIYSVVATF